MQECTEATVRCASLRSRIAAFPRSCICAFVHSRISNEPLPQRLPACHTVAEDPSHPRVQTGRMQNETTAARAEPICDACGDVSQYLQRVSRAHPADYYRCSACGRVWPADKELSAHWRRTAADQTMPRR
jgi:hypothetical protein